MFGLLKKAKEKTHRFAVQSYMNDYLKKSMTLYFGSYNVNQLSIVRDLTSTLLSLVYDNDNDKNWFLGKDDGITVQSYFIAMLCFLYYLENINLNNDDELYEVVRGALLLMGQNFENSTWHGDTLSNKDKEIYRTIVSFLNQSKTKLENEIEDILKK